MKISPVVGTPTIPQPSNTGLSPDKIQRLKAIASGQSPTEEKPQEVVAQVEPPSNTVIKMKTNAAPESIDPPQETPVVAGTEPESVISDTGVQTKPVPEAIQQVSPQIAALAKERRALQLEAKQFAETKKSLEDRLAKYDLLEQKIKSGQALSALQEQYGLTYDSFTNEILGKQNAPDLSGVEEKILKGVDERLAAKDVAQEKAVFDHMKKNVDKLTYSSDDYPFVKAGKAQDKVMELIERTWKEQGEALDEDEALRLIDDELKENAKAYAKLLKGPEQTTQAAPQPAQKQQVPQRPGVKTLTNKDLARPSSSRRQRALAAFIGQK